MAHPISQSIRVIPLRLTQNFPFLALKTNLLQCITALLLINEQFMTRILAIFIELRTFKNMVIKLPG